MEVGLLLAFFFGTSACLPCGSIRFAPIFPAQMPSANSATGRVGQGCGPGASTKKPSFLDRFHAAAGKLAVVVPASGSAQEQTIIVCFSFFVRLSRLIIRAIAFHDVELSVHFGAPIKVDRKRKFCYGHLQAINGVRPASRRPRANSSPSGLNWRPRRRSPHTFELGAFCFVGKRGSGRNRDDL